jgi:zinc transport system permease protein
MKVVWIMLISALLILPPSTALQMARGFRATIATAAAVSVLSVMIGTVLSFLFDLPTGATIVILNFLFFIAAFAAHHFRRRRK